MIKKYKVFGFSLALSAAIYFFLFGQENFQKLNFQKDLQLNFIDNASFEEKKNKIDSIINLSSNNPAQVYFLANYLFDKTEYALASRTLEHFILNFPNDTDAEVIALTAETKYLSNNQIFNDDIESLVQQSLNKDPANVRALILKGLKQTLDKNYDDALKSWSIAFEYSEDADQKRVIMAGMSSALKQLKSLED
jgi:cytochrome c-type biogenesis protein CcmH/NrfG|tara:strand:+ start:355 stop:936 length:582 start_codon:yes stop_codon:yes gene_type:complete